MKPPFKIGQDVVCVESVNWMFLFRPKKRWFEFWKEDPHTNGPKKGQVCQVTNCYHHRGGWFLCLLGWESFGEYDASFFRSVESKSESLSEQTKEVIKETQTLIMN